MYPNRITLSNILFQQSAIEKFANSLISDNPPRTMLFTGAQSCGKMTVAIASAALMQCQQPIKTNLKYRDSCGNCASCKRIAEGSHPDLHLVEPEGYEIKIDQIRAMQKTASLNPFTGKKQIFIINPAEKLNVSSSNSLLKTLEETPAESIFILIAQNESSVLPTIKSRARTINFISPSHQQARKALNELYTNVPSETAWSLSEGKFGLARIIAEKFDNLVTYAKHGESQSAFLVEIKASAINTAKMIENQKSSTKALKILNEMVQSDSLSLLNSRKQFCRNHLMSAYLPESFSSMFTKLFETTLDESVYIVKQSFSEIIKDVKKAYGTATVKDYESQLNNLTNSWKKKQYLQIISIVQNYFVDAHKWFFSKNEKLLLNLDVKEDIIIISKVYSSKGVEGIIETLEKGIQMISRHVQPSLVVEDILTMIGGRPA